MSAACPWCGRQALVYSDPGDGLDRPPVAVARCPKRCMGAAATALATDATPAALAAAEAQALGKWERRA
jgi:hypothetical protein